MISLTIFSCVCRAWFDDAQKSLPRPLRPIYVETSPSWFNYVRHWGTKRRDIELHSDSLPPAAVQMDDVHKQRRLERRGYKNVHVHFAELPETPPVSNVRGHTKASLQRKRRQKFTSSSPSKRSAMSTLANRMPPPILQRPADRSSLEYPSDTDVVMLDAFPSQNNMRGTSASKDATLLDPISDDADEPLMMADTEPWKPVTEPWKEVTEAWKYVSEPWKDVTEWLTDLEMDPLSNPLFQGATSAVPARLDGIPLTPKSPSVISEPYWLAMSSTQSVWAAESAPSEFEGHLDIRVPSSRSTTVTTSQRLRDGTKKPGGREVGRKLGPGRRKQASEIRKIRACVRCRFLKKTVRLGLHCFVYSDGFQCDKGDPCAGCQPSVARLWHVPCTRTAIEDLDYFMKDWRTDYERRLNLGLTTQNVKGFGEEEQDFLINHGHSPSLPLKVRRVYLRDPSYLDTEWTESLHGTATRFTVPTESLSVGMCGVSSESAREYIDLHFETSFESVVAHYFKDIPFNRQLMQAIYRFYLRDRTPAIRNALKVITGYILTHHISLVNGQHAPMAGSVEDPWSRYYGKVMAPAIVNLQVTCVMGDVWRELHKTLLTDLSAYYNGVYSGDKLKHWPKIFALSTLLLILWEQMQFDSFFHMEVCCLC